MPVLICRHAAGSVRSSNRTSQQVILQFPQDLPMHGQVPVVRLQFSYALQEGLDGFYRSSYIGVAAVLGSDAGIAAGLVELLWDSSWQLVWEICYGTVPAAYTHVLV